jgi:Raf kinase inhibitor-like YbhB/YbcL family protein
MKNFPLFPTVLLALLLAGSLLFPFSACAGPDDRERNPAADLLPMSGAPVITLRSPAFENKKPIPKKYTCDGENVSPPLTWETPTTAAVSLALLVEDPDAPVGTWTHWILFDLPPDLRSLPENVPHEKVLKNGARQGTNDFKEIGYGGPCPPPEHGPHRYFFRLYALDVTLNLPPTARRLQVIEDMKDHVLAYGVLMGTYER